MPRQLVWRLVAVSLLAGCSGSSTSPTVPDRATAVLTIRWPARTADRLVPTLAESIRVDLAVVIEGAQDAGSATQTQTVDRPASGNESTVTFQNVPLGQATVVATAYPEPGAQGVAQATGSVPFTAVAGEVSQVTLTMASTVTSWAIVSTPAPRPAGQTVTLTATALDAAGATVLVPPATWQIATGSDRVSLLGAGPGAHAVVVRGDAGGQATITASTTQETGQPSSVLTTAPVTVTVVALPTVTGQATPARPTITQPVSFSASATVDPALGAVASWDWDLDGDGVFELTGLAAPAAQTSYATAGDRNAAVRVTDNYGSTATDVVPVPVTVTQVDVVVQ